MYIGNGAYCYSNSLCMCLQKAGIGPHVTSSLIECLGGMPFGAGYFHFGDSHMFFPSSPANEPDQAISRALSALGWTCDESRTAETDPATDALLRLRSAGLPAQVGPMNNGWLTYDPNHGYLSGVDHYITVLRVDADQVQVHDPAGYPFATLPLSDFLQAWQAEGVSYGPNARPLAYVLRANFRPCETVNQQEVQQRGLARMRDLLHIHLTGPEVFSGPDAYRAAAADLRAGKGDDLREHLIRFSLPLGARRTADAAAFLASCGEHRGAACLDRKAQAYGAALYPATHRQWDRLASQFDELAALEENFLDVII